VDFPREWPLPEDEPPLHLKIEKLALKTRLRYGRAATPADASSLAL
jgi:hypothetical protein